MSEPPASTSAGVRRLRLGIPAVLFVFGIAISVWLACASAPSISQYSQPLRAELLKLVPAATGKAAPRPKVSVAGTWPRFEVQVEGGFRSENLQAFETGARLVRFARIVPIMNIQVYDNSAGRRAYLADIVIDRPKEITASLQALASAQGFPALKPNVTVYRVGDRDVYQIYVTDRITIESATILSQAARKLQKSWPGKTRLDFGAYDVFGPDGRRAPMNFAVLSGD